MQAQCVSSCNTVSKVQDKCVCVGPASYRFGGTGSDLVETPHVLHPEGRSMYMDMLDSESL